jgi:Holliday junction resolvase-like predicted endonuclease
VEVKARKKIAVVEEVLSNHQKHRIKKAIEVFAAKSGNKFKNCGIRCDLIVVLPKKLPQHFIGFWE